MSSNLTANSRIDFNKLDDTAIDAIRCLNAMEDVAHFWHPMFSELAALQASAVGRAQPLPQWMCEVLDRYQTGDYSHYLALFTMTRRFLECAAGMPADLVYEVWDLSGQRLDGQFQFAEHAATALATHRVRWPNAMIACVNQHAPVLRGTDDPALLDTLIGDVRYLGSRADASGERLHDVQDFTGRTATVRANDLRTHSVFDRLTESARATFLTATH